MSDVSEITVGWDASVDRAHLDAEINCIIVAGDCSPVPADGLLMSWNVFARQPGTVALDVRPFSVLSHHPPSPFIPPSWHRMSKGLYSADVTLFHLLITVL